MFRVLQPIMLVMVVGLSLLSGGMLAFGNLMPESTDTITFVSDENGDLDIYALMIDRSQLRVTRNLTVNPADDSAPAWSPSGDRMAFVSSRSGRPNVFLMSPDGAQVTQLTHFDQQHQYVHMLSWSPDGRHIAFTSNHEFDWQLYVMRADGTNMHRVWDGEIITSAIDWSPDGRYIVFVTNDGNNHNDGLYLLDLIHGDIQLLTHDHYWNSEPRWSPDGSSIVYRSHRGGVFQLYMYDIRTGTSRPIYELGRLTGTDPTWSPNGEQILFTSRSGRGMPSMLMMMSPDGSALVTLETGIVSNHYMPDWRPHP